MSIKSLCRAISTNRMVRAVPVTLASSLALTGQLCSAEASVDETSDYLIEEIIITANKRAESLQDVSASISAVTSEDIEIQGLDNFESFARTLPGVNLTQPAKNRSVFNIRGVSTTTYGANTQDPVSVYINDMPVTDTFGAAVQPDLRLYDVERIEVLRGPQGTMFGSGSLGGTVRVITRKPQLDTTDASVRVDMADTESAGLRERYDAMVNIPLIENSLAVRAVGYYRDELGWVDNIALGTDNSSRDWGGRVSVLWQAADDLTVKLEALHQNSAPDDGGNWDPSLGKFKKSSIIAEGRPSELTTYNLTLEYDIEEFATVTSSTSYAESVTAVRQQYAEILGFPLIRNNAPWKSNFLTQELRLVSNTDSDLGWVAGVFFVDRETEVDYNYRLNGIADAFNPLLGFYNLPLLEDDVISLSATTSSSQELAAFGEVSYRFADQWTVTGGLRISDTEVEYDEPSRVLLNPDFANFGFEESSVFNKGQDTGNVTWRATLAYEPVEDLRFYFNTSKGYRIGQVNPNSGPSPFDPDDIEINATYQPDETLNYELGAKTMWWDGRVKLNAAVYLIEWSDIQVDSTRTSDSANFVANAGEATSKGLELELQVLPFEGLELSLAVTLQDAKIDSIGADDSLRSGVVNGDALPGSIDHKVSAAAQYNWALSGGEEMYARVAAQYVDSSLNGFSNQGGTGLPNASLAKNAAYENVDASIGLMVDKWELTLYGENLTNNDDYIVDMGGLYGPNTVSTLRPRTLGARVHYRY